MLRAAPPRSALLNLEMLEQRDAPAVVTLNTLVVTQGQSNVEITLNRDSDFGLQQVVNYTFGVKTMNGMPVQADPGTITFVQGATNASSTHYLSTPFDPMDLNFYFVNITEDPANNIYTSLPPTSPPPNTSTILGCRRFSRIPISRSNRERMRRS